MQFFLALFAGALPLSIAISTILCFAFLAFYLAGLPASARRYPMNWGAVEIAFAVFLGLGILSACAGAAPGKSFYTLRDDLYFFIYALVAAVAAPDAIRQRLLRWFIWGSVAAALAGLLQAAIGVSLLNGTLTFAHSAGTLERLPHKFLEEIALSNGRVVGTRSHPLTYAECLLFALAYCLCAFFLNKNGKKVWRPAAVIILFGAALLLSQGRGTWLAAAAMGVVLLAWQWTDVSKRRLWILALPFVVILATPMLSRRLQTIADPAFSSNAERFRMWKAGVQMIRDHPLLGVGPGNVKRTAQRYQEPQDLAEGPWGHLHNTFMNMAVERGLLGLLSFLALIACFAARLHQTARRFRSNTEALVLAAGGMLGLVGFLISGITETVYNDTEVLMTFYFVMGLSLAPASPAAVKNDPGPTDITSVRNLMARLLAGWRPVAKTTPAETRQQLKDGRIRKILFLRPQQGIGDYLLATPAFRALRNEYPGVELHALTSAYNTIAVRDNPRLAKVWIFDKARLRNPRELLRFISDLRREKFDLAIPFFSNIPSFTSFAIAHVIGARILWSYDTDSFYGGATWSRSLAHVELPPPPESTAEYLKFAGLVSPLAPMPTLDTEFQILPEDEAAVAQIWPALKGASGQKTIAFFLGGNPNRPDRLWLPDRWAELARQLNEAGHHVIAICPPRNLQVSGGVREPGFYQDFSNSLKRLVPVFDLPGMGKAGALVRRLDLFICPDGGLFHIACAVGARTLGLFFSSDPDRWSPPLAHVDTLRAPNGEPSALAADRVFHAAQRHLQSLVSR